MYLHLNGHSRYPKVPHNSGVGLATPVSFLLSSTMFSFGERLGMLFPIMGGWYVLSTLMSIATHGFTASQGWLSPSSYSSQW